MSVPSMTVIPGSPFEVDLDVEVLSDAKSWFADPALRHPASVEQLLRYVVGRADRLLDFGELPPPVAEALVDGEHRVHYLNEPALGSPTALWRAALPELVEISGADTICVGVFIEPLPGLGIVRFDAVTMTEHHAARIFVRPDAHGFTRRAGQWLRAEPTVDQAALLYSDLTDVRRAMAEVKSGPRPSASGGRPSPFFDLANM